MVRITFAQAFANKRGLSTRTDIVDGIHKTYIGCRYRGKYIITQTRNYSALNVLSQYDYTHGAKAVPTTAAERMEYRDAYSDLINECINNNK